MQSKTSRLDHIKLKIWDHTNTYITSHYTCRTMLFKHQDELKCLLKRLERREVLHEGKIWMKRIFGQILHVVQSACSCKRAWCHPPRTS